MSFIIEIKIKAIVLEFIMLNKVNKHMDIAMRY